MVLRELKDKGYKGVIMSHISRVNTLIKRALEFLKEAERDLAEGLYNLAIFHTEQSLQLYLKAVLLKLTGYYPEAHGIRTLLSKLHSVIGKDEIIDFIRKYRKQLIEIEEAYIQARYGRSIAKAMSKNY
ncbi:MAG TPA: HEPN domain-containing protein [Acidilobales archaeon]|nr:HEPN domain-containing protein [Acidilobales archaeon]